jgi:hypothetical protein
VSTAATPRVDFARPRHGTSPAFPRRRDARQHDGPRDRSHHTVDASLAHTILSQAGAAALYLYLAQAKCVGLEHPRPYPKITQILPGHKFRCAASPTGWCQGLHSRRHMKLTYGTTDAWSHELFHSVLCQLPRRQNPHGCDGGHRSPLWSRCAVPDESGDE